MKGRAQVMLPAEAAAGFKDVNDQPVSGQLFNRIAGRGMRFKRQDLTVDAEALYAVGLAPVQRIVQGMGVVQADIREILQLPRTGKLLQVCRGGAAKSDRLFLKQAAEPESQHEGPARLLCLQRLDKAEHFLAVQAHVNIRIDFFNHAVPADNKSHPLRLPEHHG